MKMSSMDWIVWVLLFVGGLNWGLVGAFRFNIVETIFGDGVITRVIYILVGLAALWSLISVFSRSGGGSSTDQSTQ